MCDVKKKFFSCSHSNYEMVKSCLGMSTYGYCGDGNKVVAAETVTTPCVRCS